MKSKFRIHRLKLDDSGVLEPSNYLSLVLDKNISFVNALLRERSNLKPGMSIAVRQEKPMESEAVETFFNSPKCRIAGELTTEDEYMQQIDALMTQLNVFATGGSGWVVETMKQLKIKTAACGNVTRGSFMEKPPILKALKRSIVNVVDERDNFCFDWIASAIFSFVGRPHSPKVHKKNWKIIFQPEVNANAAVRHSYV